MFPKQIVLKTQDNKIHWCSAIKQEKIQLILSTSLNTEQFPGDLRFPGSQCVIQVWYIEFFQSSKYKIKNDS